MHPVAAQVLANLSLVYQEQGNYDKAVQLGGKAIEINEALFGSRHPRLADSLSVLAGQHYAAGQIGEAHELMLRIYAIYTAAYGDNHPRTTDALINLAELDRSLGKPVSAQQRYEQARRAVTRIYGNRHPKLAHVLNNLAALQHGRGEQAKAEKLYRQADTLISDALGDGHPDRIAVNLGLSRLYESMQRPEDALETIRVATQIQRGRSATSDDAVDELKKRRQLFERHLALFSTVSGDQAAGPLLTEALEVAQLALESGTARSVARMAARFAAGEGEIGELLRERGSLHALRDKLDEQLLSASGMGAKRAGNDDRQRLSTRRSETNEKLRETEKELREDFPQFEALINPQPLSLAVLQSLLRDDEALLLTLFTNDAGYLIVVSANAGRMYRSDLGNVQLGRQVARIRSGIDIDAASRLNADGLPASFSARDAAALYKNLLVPAEPLIRNIQTLLVVADGPLQNIPLQLLLTEETAPRLDNYAAYRSAPWLARRFAVSYLPSVNALYALRKVAGVSHAEKDFLGIGDPLLADHPGVTGNVLSASVAQSARGAALGKAVSANRVDVDLIQQLPSLPETARELEILAGLFGKGKSRLVLRGQATEPVIRTSLKLDEFRVISFATHGLLTGDLPQLTEPALIMTPPEQAVAGDDGLLSASEIAVLKLDADLVILSACNTAAPEGSFGAEGLSGLAKAFLHAGARALMVSHWSVASEPTVTLMARTLSSLMDQQAVNRAQAHREAIIKMLDDQQQPEYAHPSIWAPFVMVGEVYQPKDSMRPVVEESAWSWD